MLQEPKPNQTKPMARVTNAVSHAVSNGVTPHAGDHVRAALANLRAAGIIPNDPATLNHAWRELHQLVPATTGDRCERRGCHQPGQQWTEPAGTWCRAHVPKLWRDPYGNPWATPKCVKCGRPGRRPHTRFGVNPVCRDHAPTSMQKYLAGGAS